MATSFSLACELGDASFDEPLRYFVTLKLLGGPAEETHRTDVAPTPTTTPVFRARAFTFPLPADADPNGWSLQLSALALVDAGAEAEMSAVSSTSARPMPRVVGEANLALGNTLIESGEVDRRVTLVQPADGASAGDAAGNIQIKLRLMPASADQPTGAPAVAAARIPPTKGGVVASGGGKGGAGPCASCDAKAREMAHQQTLVDRLMDDVAQRTSAVAKAGEEVMELRGVNKRLETDLTALRAHVEERERAMEQLASDATNVENIDMPQLQSRHRMLGAAYRADRRRMEQVNAQVSQLTAALGTQEQLAASYGRLKEAHREQAQQMQRLQEEAKKVAKYRQTAKQQEAIIQRLEALLAAALKDAKRVKTVEPQLEKLRGEHAALQGELHAQRAEGARLEGELRDRDRQLQQAIAEGVVAGKDEDEEEEGFGGGSPHAPRSEEHVKVLMRAEKAERRAAALEDEMQEMARANGREVAALKMKLAEAEAKAAGGFGSAANLVLGELTPPSSNGGGVPPLADISDPLGASLGASLRAAPPLGSSRRATPPGNRLDPLGAPLPPSVAAAS